MKKLFIFFILLLVVGCNQEPPVDLEPIPKRVQVESVSVRSFKDYEVYVGHVKSAGLVKHAFEVDGKVDQVMVSVGDRVDQGQLLATVDTEGYSYALDAARAELSSAQSQYNKALESLTYAEDLFSDVDKLYKEGISTKSEYDKVKLNLDVASSDVDSARGLVNQARTQVDVKEYMLEQTDLFASKSGIVVDVLNESGELVSAGYPVLVLRDALPVLSFGVSQEDLAFLEIDQVVDITYNDRLLTGAVISINQVPDRTTQTYEVELSLNEDLPLGAIATIKLTTKDLEGVKLPLSAIRSDGEDYVYVVVNGRVVRKNIEVLAIFNQEVVVRGLDGDCLLIIEGIMGLTPGDEVELVGDES
ncbi:efflux RND transporter periplasmic adaptor subunit [Acidaminobacter sp. JC074]|uniref:efflux RND transporter periplasmic adaptor subunit n=1 Tax=Acidaminobacter sp. JC074 TaxID=2530199 RepID=UPI001F0E9550|nr:efflux RND transporter periplasmic adaptor subunit [Acidaminobacter sp. JC074]MCH4886784.1 efflux RND transporter periplasmic adaptor subunit [Acidaminobacter sp. JC074]